jgi:hypothetical protein
MQNTFSAFLFFELATTYSLASILEKSQGYHVTVKGKERYLVQLLYGKEGTLTTKENCALQFVKIQKNK